MHTKGYAMARTAVGVGLVAAFALTLTSCGQGDDPSSTQAGQAPATVTVTVTAAPEGPISTTASPESTTTTSAPTSATQDAAATTVPEDGGKDFGEAVVNDRGNLVKDIGQWGGVRSSTDDDVTLATFRVTNIDTDFKCTSEYFEKATNGRFLALTLEVETTPELAQEEYMSDVWINPHEFSVFDEDGSRENDSVGSAYSCAASRDMLPDMIGPGEKASGLIVLDTAVESGAVVFEGTTFGGSSGWEWKF